MKKFYFTFTLCLIFCIQVLFAQKLVKIYDSNQIINGGSTRNSVIKEFGEDFYKKNAHSCLTKTGCIIEYSDKKSNTLIFDYIDYEGRSIHNKTIIKSDIDKDFNKPSVFIADSSRLILLKCIDGIFNILVYDTNTGLLLQKLKTTVRIRDLLKKSKDKIRSLANWDIFSDKYVDFQGEAIIGNKVLITINLFNYNPANPKSKIPVLIDISIPAPPQFVIPDFPQLNEAEHNLKDQCWYFVAFDSGMFIYTRNYILDKGPNTGNACTIAEFENEGKLVRSIDLDLTLDGYNTFHTFKNKWGDIVVQYNSQENCFYFVSPLKSDKKINENKYGLVLKKIDLSGKVIWEEIYFDKEYFNYWIEDCDEIKFKYPIVKLSPMNKTISIAINLCNEHFKVGSLTFNILNGEFIDKKITPFTIFDSEHMDKHIDSKLEDQIKDIMEVNKYKIKIPLFYEYGKKILVLFQDANGDVAIYKYQ